MKKNQINQILNDHVEFYPPKQIIEFVIDDGLQTTGSIEEYNVGGVQGWSLYIDGDEIGSFDSVEDAKTEVANWVNK